MASCRLIIQDEVNIKLEGLDIDVRRKIANALKFEVPYAKYMPQYKLGRWDGKVAFFGIGGSGYVNHLDVVQEVLLNNNVEITSVSFDDEVFRIDGSNVVMSLIDVTDVARAAGEIGLLDITQSATLDDLSFPNGAHVAEVEIDPETGYSVVVRYVIVDDFGYLLNPMLVEGQVHGGVVQGLGQAMMERVVYDEDGQLLTASFMDYGMPRAADVPMFEFNNIVVPSTANPIGMKGCGEAGTIGSMAAVSNAMMDALAGHNVKIADMPFTPQRVWKMLQAAR